MVNQLPNMCGIHSSSHVDTRKSTGNKNLNRSRDATKYFHTYLWDCCHHQFQDFEASFFPVEYSFAHFLFVSEVFKVNFDREQSVRCAAYKIFSYRSLGLLSSSIKDFKALSSPIEHSCARFLLVCTWFIQMYFYQGSSENKGQQARSFKLRRQTSFQIMLITPRNKAKIFGPCSTFKISEQRSIA